MVLSYILTLWGCCKDTHPSTDKIMEMTSSSRKSVIRARQELTQLGLITMVKGNGRGNASRYEINPIKLNEFLGVKLCIIKENHSDVKKEQKPAAAKDAIYQYAKENRENPTPAESRFKNFLVKNKIAYKFQVPVCCEGEGYIIDFVIHSKSLNKDIAVEIDGGYHNKPDQVQKDKIREDNIKESGYEVVRFKNEETEKNTIYDALFRKMSHIGASDILNKITVKKYLN